jgi:hypothetical protein
LMLIGLPTSAAASGFTVRGSGKPASGPAVAPEFVELPELSGAGTIDTLLFLATEVTGDPTPLVSFRWLRDGMPIPGAGGPAYAPSQTDDLATIRCRVTAANDAGSISAESSGIIARHAAPIALFLADRVFEQGSGAQTIDAGAGFKGAGLSFALTGPPGLASIPQPGS